MPHLKRNPSMYAWLLLSVILITLLITFSQARQNPQGGTTIVLMSDNLKPRANSARSLWLDGFFYETSAGRVVLPEALTAGFRVMPLNQTSISGEWRSPEGRSIRISIVRRADAFTFSLNATPNQDITRWGLAAV